MTLSTNSYAKFHNSTSTEFILLDVARTIGFNQAKRFVQIRRKLSKKSSLKYLSSSASILWSPAFLQRQQRVIMISLHWATMLKTHYEVSRDTIIWSSGLTCCWLFFTAGLASGCRLGLCYFFAVPVQFQNQEQFWISPCTTKNDVFGDFSEKPIAFQ